MLGRVSVAIAYPFLFLALVFGVALLLGSLAVSGAERISSDLVAEITRQATARMRLSVADHLSTPRHLSQLNAERIRQGLDDPSDVRSLIGSFATQLQSFPMIGAILVSNPDLDTMWIERTEAGLKAVIFDAKIGKCVERQLDDEGQVGSEVLGSYPYDPTIRPWYIAAVDGGDEGAWSPLYEWATTAVPKPLGMGRSVEVRDEEGKRLAIIDIGLTVEMLSHELAQIEVSPNGRVFIMEEGGRFVATDRGSILSEEETLIRDAAVSIAAKKRAAGAESLVNASETLPDGTRYFVDAEHLALDWAPAWTLVTAIPEDDLLARVRATREQMMMWGIALLALAAVVGVLLARSIVRPIVALRTQARAMSDGDLDSTFEGRGGLEFKALAQDLDSMRRGLKERLEMRASLAVAMEVQQNLLPKHVPESSVIDIAAFSTYCDETGGDYYDFPDHASVERFGDGSILVVIGDVTGHGIAAALIMATARAAIRTRLLQEGSLGAVLSGVNDVLAADIPGGRFMTLLAMTISPDGSVFKWASAGHDPPIILDSDTGEFREPEGGDVPLGIMPDVSFEEYECPAGVPGSIVVAGTDGIWETADPSGALYGKDRLREIIAREHTQTAQEIGDAIIADLDRYRESDRPLDDVTLIVWKRRL